MLRIIQHGITIPLIAPVVQSCLPFQIKMNALQCDFVDKKLKDLLSQGCITKTEKIDPSGFVSNIFLVPEKEKNSFRMILNLKHLNKFMSTRHFKMDSIKDVQRLVARGFWIATCDITDAFPHLMARKDQQKLLQFCWNDSTYRFCTMPQGLASAPYEFTRVCKKIAGYLRGRGVFCVFYIEDVVIIGSTFAQCQKNVSLVVQTLTKCGFLINYKKLLLVPSQCAAVLGFLIDSVSETISLAAQKRDSLLHVFSQAVQQRSVKIRELARWIGLCISILPCFPQGKLHYHQLEHSKLCALRYTCFKWHKTMVLSERDIKILRWWLHIVNNNKLHVYRAAPFSAFLTTDSSDFGWGCCLNSNQTAGSRFSHQDVTHPINSKELLAIYYSLKTFRHELRG